MHDRCWSLPYENNAHWRLFPIVQNVCYLNRCSAGVALLAWTLLILERISGVQVTCTVAPSIVSSLLTARFGKKTCDPGRKIMYISCMPGFLLTYIRVSHSRPTPGFGKK
jgi:hypothetical protein